MKNLLLVVLCLCAWQRLALADVSRMSAVIAANTDGYLVTYGQQVLCDSCSGGQSVASLRLDAHGIVVGVPFLVSKNDSMPLSTVGAGSNGWLVQTQTGMFLIDPGGTVTNVSLSFINEDLSTHVFVGDGWVVARGTILVHQRLDGSTASAHSLAVDTTSVADIALDATPDGHILVAWSDGVNLFYEQLDTQGNPTTAVSEAMLDLGSDGGVVPQLRVIGTSEGWLVYTTMTGLGSLEFVALDGTLTDLPLPGAGGADTRFAVPSTTGVIWVDVVGDDSSNADNDLVLTSLGPDGTSLPTAPQTLSGFSTSFVAAAVAPGSGLVLVQDVFVDQATEEHSDITITVFDASNNVGATPAIPNPPHNGCSVGGEVASSAASMALVFALYTLMARAGRATTRRRRRPASA